MAELRAALLDAVSPDVLKAVVEKLSEMALGGDLAAIELLLTRTVGKPFTPADPDRVELADMELRKERLQATTAISEAEISSLMNR